MGRHGPGVLGGQGETSELTSKGPVGLSQADTGRHHVGRGPDREGPKQAGR